MHSRALLLALAPFLAAPTYDPTGDASLAIELGGRVQMGDFVTPADHLTVHQLTSDVIRVTWDPPAGRAVGEVSLFLAGDDRVARVAHTSSGAPYAGTLQVTVPTGYVGVAVTWDDGTRSTALLRYVAPDAAQP